jgi:hypothetical protein
VYKDFDECHPKIPVLFVYKDIRVSRMNSEGR